MMQHFKTAWAHIRRSPYQSLAAILTMTLMFYVASVFIVNAINFQQVLSYFEKQPQITVFFSDTKSDEDIRLLDEKLRSTGKVEKTVFVSKEDALAIYQEQNKENPLLLEMVTADILPSSLEISAIDPVHLQELADIIGQEQGVEDINFEKEVVDTLVAWTKGIRIIGIVLVSILMVNSLLVLLTVISMKIALKHEEIQILRLLGATGWYIRWPFILEGGVYGFIASILAWGSTYGTILYATPYLLRFFGDIPAFSFSASFMLLLLGVMIAAGFLLGVLGSLMALIRYL